MIKENDMTAAFVVADMTCGHCEKTVRAALEDAFPGADIRINLENHRVSVEGDTETAAAAIREAGYTPEPTPA
jgi:copper chaperone